MKKKLTIISILIFILFKVNAQEEYSYRFFKGEYDSIMKYSSQLLTEDDFYWRARVLNEQNNTQEAISILEKGIKNYNENKLIKILLADYYYKSYQYSKALDLYKTELNDKENFIKTINILDFQDKNRKCIELLKQRITWDTTSIEIYQMLGDNYFKLDSINQSINFYKKVLIINPDNQKYAYKLAVLYNKTKKFDDAIVVCDSVISNDSSSLNFVKLKGIACFRKDDYKTASDCFERLISLGDSSVFILKNTGICKNKLNESVEAKPYLRNAYIKDTTDFETTYFLSKCYENSVDIDSGLYFLQKTEELLMPDSATMSAIYIDKAKYYDALTDFKLAVECYMKAYSYKRVNGLLFNIASIYEHKLNKKEKALKYYMMFIENVDNIENSTLIGFAQERVTYLKEELFFEGKLNSQ